MMTSRVNGTNSFRLKDNHCMDKGLLTARDKFPVTSELDGGATFRVRSVVAKVNLTQKKAGALRDLFQNFEGFIRGMIERGEEVASEEDLYLKFLSEYLDEDTENIKHLKRIEIIADTTNLSLQTLGETLKELTELKLNGSIIRSIRDLGTSYKALKVLWISRVGLKDLYGLLPLQNLEELYGSFNYVSDMSEIEYIGKLKTLDLEANNIEDIKQLTYIPSSLKNITLTDNKVTLHPDYLKTLLLYDLLTIDDIDVVSIKKSMQSNPNVDISSPVKTVKMKIDDVSLIERFKKYGVNEEIVKESIKLADGFLKTEPTQNEILRQSIKIANTKNAIKDIDTKTVNKNNRGRKDVNKDAVVEDKDHYSELVSNTDIVFAGNPLKAARQKRLKAGDKLKIMNIYDLIEQFKEEADYNKEEMTVKIRGSSLETVKNEIEPELNSGIATARVNDIELEKGIIHKTRLEELKSVKVPNKNIKTNVLSKNKDVVIKRIKHIKKV